MVEVYGKMLHCMLPWTSIDHRAKFHRDCPGEHFGGGGGATQQQRSKLSDSEPIQSIISQTVYMSLKLFIFLIGRL